MAKNAITTIKPAGSALAPLPAFMQQNTDGLDSLREYVILPRLKVVQKQSGKDFLDLYNIGDVVAMPTQQLVLELGKDDRGRPLSTSQALRVTPIFFYPEAACWNPIEMKGSEPAITYRTTNINDPAFAKARNANTRMEDTGQEKDGKKLYRRWVEHLIFVCVLHDHPISDPVAISFQRGEFTVGRTFSSLISQRRAPIYGGVYELRSTYRPDRGKGDWYGLQPSNPAENPWVSSEQYETCSKLHADIKAAHEVNRVTTDLEDAVVEEEAVSGPRDM